MQRFVDINDSRSIVYSFVTAQCYISTEQERIHSVKISSEEKIQQRYNWVQKWQQTELNFTMTCVFLDKLTFHTNLEQNMI